MIDVGTGCNIQRLLTPRSSAISTTTVAGMIPKQVRKRLRLFLSDAFFTRKQIIQTVPAENAVLISERSVEPGGVAALELLEHGRHQHDQRSDETNRGQTQPTANVFEYRCRARLDSGQHAER